MEDGKEEFVFSILDSLSSILAFFETAERISYA